MYETIIIIIFKYCFILSISRPTQGDLSSAVRPEAAQDDSGGSRIRLRIRPRGRQRLPGYLRGEANPCPGSIGRAVEASIVGIVKVK